MKKGSMARFIAALLIVLFITAANVFASPQQDIQKTKAQAIYQLGLLHAYSKGDLKLASKLKRCEFISLLNCTMSYEVQSDSKASKINFKDINAKHWAYNDIRAAAAHGIISGYKDNTIKPDRYITYAEALDMTLKALGYRNESSEATAVSILKAAGQTGLNAGCDLKPDKQLTRGEAAVIIYNALTIDFAGASNS